MPDTKRTPELVETVLSRMSSGDTLTDICRDVGIHPTTWRVWCREDSALDIAHAHARDAGFDVIAEDCLRIADDKSQDVKIVGEDEREVCNTEFVQRSKLRIETRLKLLAKWDPRRYGDKLELEHSGSIDMDPEARIARIAELTAKLHGAE